MVALHGAGDFFGEGCLTGQPLRLATVSAMTDCVIMRIDKTDMVRTLRDEPKLSEVFMAYILARNAAFGQLGAVGGDPSSLVLVIKTCRPQFTRSSRAAAALAAAFNRDDLDAAPTIAAKRAASFGAAAFWSLSKKI